jgi:hypothetical protein
VIEAIEPALLNFSFLTPFPGTKIYNDTKHLIGKWDYEKWDDFNETIYNNNVFEIDPQKSKDMILDSYLRKIDQGIKFSSYQFAYKKPST